jgi:hypothetical protein
MTAAMTRLAAAKLPPVRAQAALAPLWQARDRAIAELVARYVTHPWPVTFLFIVSPLVMWLWIGALIVIAGALIALWPAPALARLRARSAAFAGRRLAREPA